MYYRVERAYLTDKAGATKHSVDLPPYLVPESSARGAVMAFVSGEQAVLLGTICELTGDKAVATAKIDEQVFVVFAQRAAEAVERP